MKYRVTLNKRIYEVEVENGEAMLIDEYEAIAQAAAPAPAAVSVTAAPAAAPAPALAAGGLAAGEAVRSPMPGNILKVCVSQGQSVSEGDVVVVLEAMKMENEVVAAKSGTVVQVAVTKGQVVETGSPLVIIA